MVQFDRRILRRNFEDLLYQIADLCIFLLKITLLLIIVGLPLCMFFQVNTDEFIWTKAHFFFYDKMAYYIPSNYALAFLFTGVVSLLSGYIIYKSIKNIEKLTLIVVAVIMLLMIFFACLFVYIDEDGPFRFINGSYDPNVPHFGNTSISHLYQMNTLYVKVIVLLAGPVLLLFSLLINYMLKIKDDWISMLSSLTTSLLSTAIPIIFYKRFYNVFNWSFDGFTDANVMINTIIYYIIMSIILFLIITILLKIIHNLMSRLNL
jgi:hypothetical protein